jgi:RimJ/RimL family protein N-acetyltransferase
MALQTWVRPVTLEGPRVRLEPLSPEHLPGLIEAGADPAVWHWITGLPMDTDRMGSWLDTSLRNAAQGDEVPFATIEVATGRVVGSTRFMSIAPEHRRLEIGWTWVATERQRTGANREAKYLQLAHAFETLDAARVEFKTHARNERSRTALLGIGSTFEGVLRRHMVLADGSVRDSAYYSVLAEEWPSVKARLQARLR